MMYFVGLRVGESGKPDLQNYMDIEFYLYDFVKQEVIVLPYRELVTQEFYIWNNTGLQFKSCTPNLVLSTVKNDDYKYMYFDKNNKCVSEQKLLIIGEHPVKGVAILTSAFKLFYIDYYTCGNTYMDSYNFVQDLDRRTFGLSKFPVLRTTEDDEQESKLVESFNRILTNANALGSVEGNVENALRSGLKKMILGYDVKPLCSITQVDSDEAEGPKSRLLLMSDPDYFKSVSGKNMRMYICFPPMVTIGISSWSNYCGLIAVKFTRIEYIGAEAFRDCIDLECVEFPETGSFAIGPNAFSGTALKTVVLPISLSELSSKAFIECEKLEKVIVKAKKDDSDKTRVKRIKDSLAKQMEESKVVVEYED